jgi:hypothetical protein
VYDMYPWDSRADRSRPLPPAPRDGDDPTGNSSPDPATHAVQVALDRRDNGGGAASENGLTAETEMAAVAGQPRW